MYKRIQTVRRVQYDDKMKWWYAISDEYLYIHTAYLNCVWLILTEWKNDKHLVG